MTVADPHGPPGGTALSAELAAILAEIVPPGGAFRHREHIHLAYIAVQRYRPDKAAGAVARWIRHLAAYQRAPQKFHTTVTRAWVEIVAHHMAAGPGRVRLRRLCGAVSPAVRQAAADQALHLPRPGLAYREDRLGGTRPRALRLTA